MVRIDEEVGEKLDIVPAKILTIVNIRPKHASRACEGVQDDGATAMPHAAPQIIPQAIVIPGFLAHVALGAYAEALHLYRQKDLFARLGLDISRRTLAGWLIRVASPKWILQHQSRVRPMFDRTRQSCSDKLL